jgi:hypothetical protein
MLDFNHILSNPNIDIQTFIGQAQTTAGAATGEWKTWRKPRGAKFVYIMAVGGGASGGVALNTGTTSGGAPGGGSGAMSTLMIPAMFLPDVLYIQAGLGGSQPATLVSAALGVAGTITYVALEPWNTLAAQLTVLFASPGTATTAATTTTGGTGGTAAVIATIANMPLAGRGAYQFFVGQAGSAGGTNATAGVNLTLPTTGLIVTGGAGGGGSPTGGAGNAGGNITGVGFGDNFPTLIGGTGAATATPATNGSGGQIFRPFQHYGGAGGGGASGNNAAGIAGVGGNGAPGCGGGGAGGSNTTAPTLARPGDGGPGFVYIFSW